MTELSNNIITLLKQHGATEALYVGGYVRDKVMGIKSKDIDIEVYGLPYNTILTTLQSHLPNCDIKTVGQAFGIIKVNNTIDISVPRRDNKIGAGHKGFEITFDPNMSIKEAAARRDFTMNSLAMTQEGQILDPFNGIKDINNKVLHPTSEAFKEDPLRVLRAMQFAGRLEFSLSMETIDMSISIADQIDTLFIERIGEEWWKWASLSKTPSLGLATLFLTTWDKHWPILGQLGSIQQDPIWHPEGDVLAHTFAVTDAAAEIAIREGLDETDRAILVFAALCHDFGKLTTTQKNDHGRWIAPGHAEAGVLPTEQFLKSIFVPPALILVITKLVQEHMVHTVSEPTDRVVRRLASRLHPATIKMWSHLCESDHSGRPPKPKSNPVTKWVEIATDLAIRDSKPKPIVLGRHLLDILPPGPTMGKVLKRAYEAQLDGAFKDLETGIEWVKNDLSNEQEFIEFAGQVKAMLKFLDNK